MDQQTKRIIEMEKALDDMCECVEALQDALDAFEEATGKLDRLTEYYDSGLWRRDHDDDDAGRISCDIKRGVLSEDAIFDLLTEVTALRERMTSLGTMADD